MKRLVAAIAIVLLFCSAASAAQVWVPAYSVYPYAAPAPYVAAYPAPVYAPARVYRAAPAYYPAPTMVYAAPVPIRARVYYGYAPPPRRVVLAVPVY